jgi:hypothetical protein
VSSHGPEPLRVWLDAKVRAEIERRARVELLPAAHEAGRLLSFALGLAWRRPASLPLRTRYEPLRAAKAKSPNAVYVYCTDEMRQRLASGARVNGRPLRSFASERIYAALGVRFVPPTMGKPVVRTAEDIRRQRRVQAAKHYAAHRDEINAARRTENLSPEARERRNRLARERRAKRRAQELADLLASYR